MKALNLVPIIIFCVVTFTSCHDQKESQEVQKAMEDGMNILEQVPEMKKESDARKAAINSKQLNGEFVASLDGEPFMKSEWNTSISRILFTNNLAVYSLCLSPDSCKELIKIKISDSPIPYDKIEPTYYKTGNEGIVEDRYFSISYFNEDERSLSFNSDKGEVTLVKLTDDNLTATFIGTVQQGNFGNTTSKPFTMELNLDYDFITTDQRK
ncbi:hypothetical protein BST97_01540 [Nonlabens spongiae]|uniref:Lipoprotein n=1 Tax=Nonlabens spongiae TaxID=331648 RepID=A0A1W6MGQ3_9FLAO|nr:hypothetical protein [Nonlabens spongiae]ARN76788.1 hypothetical protein BST97_01540 [Nonlabens spongiae]